MEKYKYKELTDKIIQDFYCVYNELGYGFLVVKHSTTKEKICVNPNNLRYLRAKNKMKTAKEI
ncbi:MAG: GxxExxY protein [Tannerellaceae bacterium]|jgi:hypothetical protein|nr:GxxExxY protein [Tannerellaceae bacterium]